jgi:hypothetical protein
MLFAPGGDLARYVVQSVVERAWNKLASQGHILALAFVQKTCKPFKLFPLRSAVVARCRHGCCSRSMQIPEHTPSAGGNDFTLALHWSHSLDIASHFTSLPSTTHPRSWNLSG